MVTTTELPRGMLTATRIPHRLLVLGIPLGPLQLLETVGRHSARRRTTPIVILRAQGERWIVSPFGETDWVRNVRALHIARLGRGGRLRRVNLTEAPAELVPSLLRTYRRRYRLIPFVRAAFEPGSIDETEIAELVRRHPVFHVAAA